jgi:N utilization substance protein B
MLTKLKILGFSEAALCMIFDILESNGTFPTVEIINNLKTIAKKEYKNPLFEIIEKTSLEDLELIRNLFKNFTEEKAYIDYCQLEKPTSNDHKEALKQFFFKTMLTSELLDGHLEEQFVLWADEKPYVLQKLKDFFEDPNEDLLNSWLGQMADMDELEHFAIQLFRKTLEHNDEYETAIKEHLKNWDLDRIAMVDMILLKLAVSELLHFSNIPIKVTLNEYIEISKVYSTPKSREFINGILDKAQAELRKQNKIEKLGRGLVD